MSHNVSKYVLRKTVLTGNNEGIPGDQMTIQLQKTTTKFRKLTQKFQSGIGNY